MHSDEAIEHERKGADSGLNPMFDRWEHRFNFAPISYAANASRRAAFREVIQAELGNKFFYSNEVRLEIVLHLDVQTAGETARSTGGQSRQTKRTRTTAPPQ